MNVISCDMSIYGSLLLVSRLLDEGEPSLRSRFGESIHGYCSRYGLGLFLLRLIFRILVVGDESQLRSFLTVLIIKFKLLLTFKLSNGLILTTRGTLQDEISRFVKEGTIFPLFEIESIRLALPLHGERTLHRRSSMWRSTVINALLSGTLLRTLLTEVTSFLSLLPAVVTLARTLGEDVHTTGLTVTRLEGTSRGFSTHRSNGSLRLIGKVHSIHEPFHGHLDLMLISKLLNDLLTKRFKCSRKEFHSGSSDSAAHLDRQTFLFWARFLAKRSDQVQSVRSSFILNMIGTITAWLVLGFTVASLILISAATAEQRRNGSTTATSTVSLIGALFLILAIVTLVVGMWSV